MAPHFYGGPIFEGPSSKKGGPACSLSNGRDIGYFPRPKYVPIFPRGAIWIRWRCSSLEYATYGVPISEDRKITGLGPPLIASRPP